MKRIIALCAAVWVCGLTIDAGDPDTIVINEVYYLGGSGTDWVELKNVSGSTVDISMYWLCARFVYRRLDTLTLLDGTDLNLSPDEIATVQLNFDMNDASSDVGLYITNDFGDATDMVDFIQYGTSADVGRSDVAAPLFWTETSPGVYDFIATAAAGQSVSFDGVNAGGVGSGVTLSSDLANGTQTRSAENFNVPVELQSFTVE